MILLIGLNLIEYTARVFVGKLENAGVVKLRGVFLGSEEVGTEIAVSFLVGRVREGMEGLEGGLGLVSASVLGNCTIDNAVYAVEMLLFGLRYLGKHLFELGINCALRVLVVLVNAQLFLRLKVFQQFLFFLGKSHNLITSSLLFYEKRRIYQRKNPDPINEVRAKLILPGIRNRKREDSNHPHGC